MCGIAGFVNLTSQKPDPSIIKAMTECIAHRGPDDQGLEISGPCALGNRRLAIIDLSPAGHMPMWDKNKTICITYNGEIYNFKTLKANLLKKGYTFKSSSDTEVILNLYKEYGYDCVTHLRGMFAMAIWDRQSQELFFARDHFGIKPLHYTQTDRAFIFGSELKSILLHPTVRRTISHEALSHYFSIGFGAVPAPLTIFAGVFKLPPAHYAVYKNGTLTVKRYWDVSATKPSSIPFNEAVTQTQSYIEASVQQQLVSDVPLGSFLSGGIDSSLITAFAQKHTSHRLQTFSIGFEDKAFDESAYALKVAQILQTDHHHHTFTAKELFETLPKVLNQLDEPLADASILPTYLLSEFTRGNVTVALSGDGGDELFAGYPTYLAHKLSGLFHNLPQSSRSIIRHMLANSGSFLQTLPLLKHSPNLSLSYKLERFFEGMDRNTARQYLNFMGPVRSEIKDKLIENHTDQSVSFIESLLNNVSHWDKQKQLQYLDFNLYLFEDCLVKTDRASSYNSLEVRVPFLSVELTEFVFSLPSSYHLHNTTLKYLLKNSAKGVLPPDIINRPKKGFGIPTHIWLSNELLSIKGIGNETADTILLFAGNKPSFIVDTYTKRFVVAKGLQLSENYEELQKYFESHLPRKVDLYQDYHALIVTWGKDNR